MVSKIALDSDTREAIKKQLFVKKADGLDWGNIAQGAGVGSLAGAGLGGLSSYLTSDEKDPDKKKSKAFSDALTGGAMGGLAGGGFGAVRHLLPHDLGGTETPGSVMADARSQATKVDPSYHPDVNMMADQATRPLHMAGAGAALGTSAGLAQKIRDHVGTKDFQSTLGDEPTKLNLGAGDTSLSKLFAPRITENPEPVNPYGSQPKPPVFDMSNTGEADDMSGFKQHLYDSHKGSMPAGYTPESFYKNFDKIVPPAQGTSQLEHERGQFYNDPTNKQKLDGLAAQGQTNKADIQSKLDKYDADRATHKATQDSMAQQETLHKGVDTAAKANLAANSNNPIKAMLANKGVAVDTARQLNMSLGELTQAMVDGQAGKATPHVAEVAKFLHSNPESAARLMNFLQTTNHGDVLKGTPSESINVKQPGIPLVPDFLGGKSNALTQTAMSDSKLAPAASMLARLGNDKIVRGGAIGGAAGLAVNPAVNWGLRGWDDIAHGKASDIMGQAAQHRDQLLAQQAAQAQR